jgi:hypothetical protein
MTPIEKIKCSNMFSPLSPEANDKLTHSLRPQCIHAFAQRFGSMQVQFPILVASRHGHTSATEHLNSSFDE